MKKKIILVNPLLANGRGGLERLIAHFGSFFTDVPPPERRILASKAIALREFAEATTEQFCLFHLPADPDGWKDNPADIEKFLHALDARPESIASGLAKESRILLLVHYSDILLGRILKFFHEKSGSNITFKAQPYDTGWCFYFLAEY
ncbi:MAG: hypothetical protein WDN09_03350 [bacterium]